MVSMKVFFRSLWLVILLGLLAFIGALALGGHWWMVPVGATGLAVRTWWAQHHPQPVLVEQEDGYYSDEEFYGR